MPSPEAKLLQRMSAKDTLVCVGLDSDIAKIPERFKAEPNPQFAFNQWIIEQTAEYTAAYKPNFAFYEAQGEQGLKALRLTMDYLQEHHPDIFTIADAKRGDIGNTNQGYVTAVFDHMNFDAITVHPYLGKKALQPFLDRSDKVTIILCRTSNEGAGEFQDFSDGDQKLWETVAYRVSHDWNGHKNCMLVAGATYPQELARIREIVGPEMVLLVPGVGAQGGTVPEVMQNGVGTGSNNLIINSSRGIIFAADPAAEAKKLQQEINQYR